MVLGLLSHTGMERKALNFFFILPTFYQDRLNLLRLQQIAGPAESPKVAANNVPAVSAVANSWTC
jgi:hypothetical protein